AYGINLSSGGLEGKLQSPVTGSEADLRCRSFHQPSRNVTQLTAERGRAECRWLPLPCGSQRGACQESMQRGISPGARKWRAGSQFLCFRAGPLAFASLLVLASSMVLQENSRQPMSMSEPEAKR